MSRPLKGARTDRHPEQLGREADSAVPAPPKLGRARDWILGLAVLGGLLWVVEQTVGWQQLLAPWQTLSAATLIMAFVLTAVSYILRGVRAYDYFWPLVAGHFLDVLRLSMIHNTANNLLPMRAGEAVFPWLMKTWFGHGFFAAGASLLWIRLMDLHVIGLAGLAVLWLSRPDWPVVVLAVLWVCIPLASAFALVSRKRQWRGGAGLSARLLRLVADAAPRSAPVAARLYLWTLLSWGTKLVAFTTILGHFMQVPTWKVLIGVIGAELASIMPFHGVAGSGSYELVTVAALVPFGVSGEAALTGALNLHLFLLGSTILLGIVAVLLPGRRLLYSEKRR